MIRERGRPESAFSIYLRTGRRVARGAVELKFNPWHDPEDGRFTFVGAGRYFPSGDRRSQPGAGRGGRVGSGGAQGTGTQRSVNQRVSSGDGVPNRDHLDPRHPSNYSVHIVKRGDSLSRIAAQRQGLTVADLEWLNGIRADQPLQIGQAIKVPHQAFLDAGRDAKNKFLALVYYRETHGGKLPPDPANPPSLESQILDSNWRTEAKHGYDFQIDPITRSRRIKGELSSGPMASRSRSNQALAGGADRRPGLDDGGHYIGARFNGPSDSFNHFAQDRNFNRGAYRALEGEWAKELQSGHRVIVDIVPQYTGTSMRPDLISVTWYVDGHMRVKNFPNRAGGGAHGRK